MSMLTCLDGEIERNPQDYPCTTSGVNLHKILIFFLSFTEIFNDMINKQSKTDLDWQELLANHYMADFNLKITEDNGRPG